MDKSQLQVDFWDVGYGDATVVWLDTERVILVDCGPMNSRLPLWIEKHGLDVKLVVLTHNDQDHIGGFMKLMELRGSGVRAYALTQDRSAKKLKRIWKVLSDGYNCRHWPDPILIAPRKGKPQNLLSEAGIFHDYLKLEAVHPPYLDSLYGQTRGPNWAGALVVLSLNNIPLIAWPGDLPFLTCHKVLTDYGIKPKFLVGPHHGGPVDIKKLSSEKIKKTGTDIGHQESWISVAWNQEYGLPREEYIRPISQSNVVVRCSQLTPRCDSMPERFGSGLLPTHDWLGLEPPPKGPSCMGSMRVQFAVDGYNVAFADEHENVIRGLPDRLCRDT